MARPKKTKKAAAVADVERGEPLETVQEKHGIKSRRTLEGWVRQAKAVEGKARDDDAGEPATSSPRPDGAGAAEMEAEADRVVAMARFATSIFVRTAGMCVGFAPTSPVVVSQSKLTGEEEEALRFFAPTLAKGWGGLLGFLDEHPLLLAGAMFGTILVPRVAVVGIAAKKIREAERARRPEPKTAPSSDNGARPAPAPQSTPEPEREEANPAAGLAGGVLKLYPDRSGGET